MEFSKRLDYFGAEIFSAMDEKKKEMEAKGFSVINLSVGTPDFEPAPHIRRALSEAAEDPKNWRYSLGDLPELLEAVCAYYARRFGVKLTPEEVMSVHGSQEGIGHLGMALLNQGDLVLLPDPGYPVFTAGTLLGGGTPWYYPLKEEHGFEPSLAEIPDEIADKAKMMVVSLPENPVGSVAPAGFYEELVSWAKRHDILIIHDNAYSDIIFDGNEGHSFFNTPGAKDVGVEFFSLSKSFNVTGARISFLIGRPDVLRALKLLRSQIDFGMFLPIQKAAIAALTGPIDMVQTQKAAYQERRDALCGGARALGWNIPDSHGSMFVWAPVPEGYRVRFAAQQAAGEHPEEESLSMGFCMELLSRTGVLCTPGMSFGPRGEGYVRFALVLPPEQIREALQRISASGLLDS